MRRSAVRAIWDSQGKAARAESTGNVPVDHMVPVSQGVTAARPVAFDVSMPLNISETVMRSAMTKRSKKATRLDTTRAMRLGQDGRDDVSAIAVLRSASRS